MCVCVCVCVCVHERGGREKVMKLSFGGYELLPVDMDWD